MPLSQRKMMESWRSRVAGEWTVRRLLSSLGIRQDRNQIKEGFDKPME